MINLHEFHERNKVKVAALLIAAFCVAAVADILSSAAFAQAWDLRAPMPDSLTQHVIRDMIEKDDRDLPPMIRVSQSELRQRCRMNVDLWGCTWKLHGLTVVYIWEGLWGPRLEQTIIHEYAHALFDYEH